MKSEFGLTYYRFNKGIRCDLYNAINGAICSLNKTVDKYLRANAKDKFKMLTTGKFSQVVE